jgi:formylglycine-generating enzyme required for sulfatase activity
MLDPKFIPIVIALAQLGCTSLSENSEAGEAFYDKPHKLPVGVAFVEEEVDEGPQVLTTPEECKRGRGIDGDGNCVLLRTREHEFGGMVQMPAGAFLRGDIPQRYDSRRGTPGEEQHAQVALSGQPLFEDHTSGFWIDGYEVSRKAYADCVEEGACTLAVCLDGSDGRPTERQLAELDLGAFPQTCVTHEQAETYCKHRGYRLPSEAEWEYAARGPEAWMYPWGHQLRDELGLALGPVGFDPLDISYFGLKGFGGNAIEWVADEFEPDANIMRYVAAPFRSEDGPLARAWAAWLEPLCGKPGCELGRRYVVKGGRSGARAGAWQLGEGKTFETPPTENFEGDRTFAQHERLGFRCAADLSPDETALSVPATPPPLPVLRSADGYDVFFGVAEAVDREEAQRFCKLLVAPGDAKPVDGEPVDNGWRLPSIEEIRAIHQWFGGPGPFWTSEGAAEQTYVDSETSTWDVVTVDEGEPLMARCIRTSR